MAIACIAAAMAGTLALAAHETGVTVDEPSHLVSAHLYWRGRDVLAPGDMPPLIKIVGGWAPGLAKIRLPHDGHASWKTGHEWDVSQQMMDELRDGGTRRLFFWSRLPLIVFPVAVVVLLWWWARQLFSPAGGLVAAGLFAFSPNVLGHGALFKNDLAATFGFLAFWYAAWRYWILPDWRRAALLGAGLLAAILAKMSMLVLVPAGLAIALGRGWMVSARKAGAHLALVLVVLYAGVLTAWQFQTGPIPASKMTEWKTSPAIPALLVNFVEAASAVPTPPRMWTGAMSLVQSNGDSGPVYLLEQLHPKGHPLYFALALAVKLPVAAQIAIAAGLIVYAVRLLRRSAPGSDFFWVCPGFAYIAMASLSNLQMGIRLVLPALPFLLLFAGHLTAHLPGSLGGMRLPALLLACQMGTAAAVYPDYISHFNVWVGGPDHGIRYLSDSNLDWGQDLPRLARLVRGGAIPRLRLAYFGSDNPYAYLSDRVLEPVVPPWSDGHVSSGRYVPEPGYYAVSATLLTGQLFAPKYRDYFAAFRGMKPVAKAGYSIFVYRVP